MRLRLTIYDENLRRHPTAGRKASEGHAAACELSLGQEREPPTPNGCGHLGRGSNAV